MEAFARMHRATCVYGTALRILATAVLCVSTLLCSRPTAGAASWEDVLGRYRACRERLTAVESAVQGLDGRMERIRALASSESGEAELSAERFAGALEERVQGVRLGLRRLPGLLGEIESEIAKYRGSHMCPECIESSTFLLCATVEELASESEGCARSADDFEEHFGGDRPLEPLLQECREMLGSLRAGFERAGELEEVGPDLENAREKLAEAESALDEHRRVTALVLTLEARWTLERLAGYLEPAP